MVYNGKSPTKMDDDSGNLQVAKSSSTLQSASSQVRDRVKKSGLQRQGLRKLSWKGTDIFFESTRTVSFAKLSEFLIN